MIRVFTHRFKSLKCIEVICIWSVYKKAGFLFYITCSIYIAFSLLQTVRVYIIVELLASATEKNALGLEKNIIALLVILLVIILFSYLRQEFTAQLIKKISLLIESSFIKECKHFRYRDLPSGQCGKNVSLLTNGLKRIEIENIRSVLNSISLFSLLLFTGFALAKFSMQIFFTILVISCAMVFIPVLLKKRIKQVSKRFSQKSEEFIGLLENIFNGLQQFHIFSTWSYFDKRLHTYCTNMEQEKYRYSMKVVRYNMLSSSLGFVFQVIIYILCALAVFQEQLPSSSFLGIVDYAGTFLDSMNGLSQSLLLIISSHQLYDKFNCSTNNVVSCNKPNEGIKEIIVQNVSHSYNNDQKVIENFSYHFKEGKSYLLAGSSGKGKTTLLNIITGMIKPQSGQILYNNLDANKYTQNEISQSIAYIMQSPYLFCDSTQNNILLDRVATLRSFEEICHNCCITDELLDSKQANGSVSLGEAQRIALARGLINSSNIIIIDEGSASLDSKTAEVIEKYVLSLKHKTIIITGHNIQQSTRCLIDEVVDLDTLYNT